MADEAILRIVIDEGGSRRRDDYVPPEPSGGGSPSGAHDAESAAVTLVASARAMRLAVDTLTADISRASVSLRQLTGRALPAPAPSTSSSAPLALTYQPQSQATAAIAPSAYQKLQELTKQHRAKFSKEEVAGFSPAELEAYFEEQNEQAAAVQKIFREANLTKREMEVAQRVLLEGYTYTGAGEELGFGKQRGSQIAAQLTRKLGLPESISAAMKVSEEQSRASEQLEQTSSKRRGGKAGVASNIEARDASEDATVFLKKLDPQYKLSKAFASEWLSASSKKRPDLEYVQQLQAAMETLQEKRLSEGALAAAKDAMRTKKGGVAKRRDVRAALDAILGEHLATGGWLDPEDNPEAFMDESDFDLPEAESPYYDASTEPTSHSVVQPYGAAFELHHAGGGEIPALFGTPSPTFPDPPKYWTPEMMAMYPKDALQAALKKGDHETARQVAEYVYKYSLSPNNVYKRVLGNIGDRSEDVDMSQALEATRRATDLAKEFQPEYPSAKHFAEGGPTNNEPWKIAAAKYFGLTWENEQSNYGAAENVHKRWIEAYKRKIGEHEYIDLTFGLMGQKSARDQQIAPDKDTYTFLRKLLSFATEMKEAGLGISANGSTDKRNELYAKALTSIGMKEQEPGLYYQHGGRVDMSRGGSMPNTGRAPSGADWHPAWLTDQEIVINQKSAQRNRNALLAANANPDVKLTPHYAGGHIPYLMRAAGHVFSDPYFAGTPGRPGGPPPGGIGPPSPGTVGTPGVAPGLGEALGALGGSEAQLLIAGAHMVGEVQKELHDAVVGATASVGEWARAFADPGSDPSKLFGGMGDLITSGGEKASKALNTAVSPIASMLGIDLFPQLKMVSGAAGEAARQFGELMKAIDATSQRYGEYSPDIAVAQAMVEVKHTMGELRRAQESGPELARYIRAQGDLQQKVEDIKIKVLTKLLPLVEGIVSLVEKGMPAGEAIAAAVEALLAPVTAGVAGLNRIAGATEDANREEVADPTELVFQQAGLLQGQGIGVPQV